MSDVYIDGDLRRIYEVPEGSTFIVDPDGYRVYTSGISAESFTAITSTEIWSAWVDFHYINHWSTLAFDKQGGALRDVIDGIEIYQTFDLRQVNDWQFVAANYPHEWRIVGNVLPNEGAESAFDSDRITSAGVSTFIQFSDSALTLNIRDLAAGLHRLMKSYGMVPGASYQMPPSTGGPVLEDGEPIADVSGDCETGFTVTGRPET